MVFWSCFPSFMRPRVNVIGMVPTQVSLEHRNPGANVQDHASDVRPDGQDAGGQVPDTVLSAPRREPPVTVRSNEGVLDFKATLQNVASTTWNGFKAVLNVLHSAAGTFPPLDATVGGIVALIDVYDRTQDNREWMEETMKRMDRLFSILAGRLEGFGVDKEGASSWVGSHYMESLGTLLVEVQQLRDRHWLVRAAMSAEDKGNLRRICDSIEQCMQELQLQLGLAIETNTATLLQEARLSGLPRARAAAYTAAVPLQSSRCGCMPGTRVDVLSTITAWAEDLPSESTPVFWLSGLAGQGKTAIAYTVCERLQASTGRTSVISFFCSEQLDTAEEKNLVSTLVLGLAEGSASFAAEVTSALKKRHDLGDQKLEVQLDELLLVPWQNSAAYREDLPPVTRILVIDALDENEAGIRFGGLLLNAIRDGKLPGLRVIFTCRPNHVLNETFLKSQKLQSGSSLIRYFNINFAKGSPEHHVVHKDIEHYMQTELPEHRDTAHLQSLTDVSAGLFIFASTAVRLVRPHGYMTKTFSKEAEHMTAITDDIYKTALTVGDQHKTLSRLYGNIIHSAFDTQNFDPEDRAAGMRALVTFLLCSRRINLGISRIAQLSDVDEGRVKLLIDSLQAVLYISMTRQSWIRCYHVSFAQYVLGQQKSVVDYARPLIVAACWKIMKYRIGNSAYPHIIHVIEKRWSLKALLGSIIKPLDDLDVLFAAGEAYSRSHDFMAGVLAHWQGLRHVTMAEGNYNVADVFAALAHAGLLSLDKSLPELSDLDIVSDRQQLNILCGISNNLFDEFVIFSQSAGLGHIWSQDEGALAWDSLSSRSTMNDDLDTTEMAELQHRRWCRFILKMFPLVDARQRTIFLNIMMQPFIEDWALDDELQLVLFAALDMNDNTKLLQEAIISPLISSAPALYTSAAGCRALIYLLDPRMAWLLAPVTSAPFVGADPNREHTSQQDIATRQAKVRAAASPGLLSWVAKDGAEMVMDADGWLMVLAIMLLAEGDKDEASRALLQMLALNGGDAYSAGMSRMARLHKILLQGHFKIDGRPIRKCDRWDAGAYAKAFVEVVGRERTRSMARGAGASVVAALVERVRESGTEALKKEVTGWFDGVEKEDGSEVEGWGVLIKNVEALRKA